MNPLRPEREFAGRHRPASGVRIELGEPTIVFLTGCTDKRVPWLARADVHEHLRAVWNEAQAWLVGNYVLLPDHLHLFCAPRDLNIPLDRWVSYWKRLFTQRTRNPEWTWQSLHWDTRLRRSENYTQKWHYVRENPVRKGLVKNADEWPFQGMINVLPW
jgi:putative transposase